VAGDDRRTTAMRIRVYHDGDLVAAFEYGRHLS
jgi:hypothetical protein